MLIAVVVAGARNQALTTLDRIAALLRPITHTHIVRAGLAVVTAVPRTRAGGVVTTATHIAVRAVVAVVTNRTTRLTRHRARYRQRLGLTHQATALRTLRITTYTAGLAP